MLNWQLYADVAPVPNTRLLYVVDRVIMLGFYSEGLFIPHGFADSVTAHPTMYWVYPKDLPIPE